MLWYARKVYLTETEAANVSHGPRHSRKSLIINRSKIFCFAICFQLRWEGKGNETSWGLGQQEQIHWEILSSSSISILWTFPTELPLRVFWKPDPNSNLIQDSWNLSVRDSSLADTKGLKVVLMETPSLKCHHAENIDTDVQRTVNKSLHFEVFNKEENRTMMKEWFLPPSLHHFIFKLL